MNKPETRGEAIPTKLQLSKGYLVRFDQLARLLNVTCRERRERHSSSDLAESVGVATAHLQHLCSIAQALGITTPRTYKPTSVGRLICEMDSFFDDIGTLWFLHYSIASDPRYVVWNRFSNVLSPSPRGFSLLGFRALFDDLKSQLAKYSGNRHISKETLTVLDAYTNQNFSRLAYLRADDDRYSLSYREPVPPLVLAACIARYRARHRPGDTAISVADLLTAPNSPGWICQIPEDRLRASLEELRTQPGLALESRADLDQVRLTDNTPDHVWMERYYASR